jgi:hypothetical protein
VAGIAAAAGRAWPDAETHFENALRTADEMPHRVEQPEVRRWYARTLLDRTVPATASGRSGLLAEPRATYEKIGVPKHVEMVDAMLAGGRLTGIHLYDVDV